MDTLLKFALKISLVSVGVLAIASSGAAQAPPYDLLLKGGHVIDPANDVDAVRDVAITARKIAAVAKDIPASEAKKVVDVTGLYVTPGLIDIHYHIATAALPWTGLRPKHACTFNHSAFPRTGP